MIVIIYFSGYVYYKYLLFSVFNQFYFLTVEFNLEKVTRSLLAIHIFKISTEMITKTLLLRSNLNCDWKSCTMLPEGCI